ncbi:zinc transporter ZIP1 isoform X2 [Canis lupus dingo]|uniref:zinc transporter ZIP1 isoform X2 n=1 Tax=Canis lupus dingo TaxID=286419 RepID=UPI000BAA06AE|nr:zinc transporter ZIP1 isoform X2 [Canis lupus dingo]|eukprot:XP_022277101.1 zinc transporter ZIP1 isoform X2 [Canis lupus familiaris]
MGPWGEPELLVWRPEAVASEPPGPVGLEVKMGALVLLLLLTLLCSLVPICVLRRPGAGPEALAPVPPTRVYPGNGLLPSPGDGADHTSLQGAVGATTSRGDEGAAGNGKWWATALARWARGSTGRWSSSSPLSPACLRTGLLPGPALGVRRIGSGAAARPGSGHGAVPGFAAPQGYSGSQLVPAAAAEPSASAGGSWLWDPLLMHDTSGHWAGCSSGRVCGATAPAGPVCAGGHGGWHLSLYHLPGNPAPGAGRI